MLSPPILENAAYAALAAQNRELERKLKEHAARLEAAVLELHASQQQLVQKERLSALGAMVTGLAHDFNNSLALILGAGEMLQQKSPPLDPSGSLAGYTQTIITAALDAAWKVQRLREFHRPTEIGELRAGLCLGELARQAVEFTRPRWEAETHARGLPIVAEVEVEGGTFIAGNAAEIRELLTNLIFNAVDAMPQGGALALRVCGDAEKVTLEVEDTGIGMSEAVRERCLEPFFTTKSDRSGLGLATVYGILERHNGAIAIASEPGIGTRVVLDFPADLSGARADDAGAPAARRAMRILVVDDQAALCDLLAEALERDWHSVEVAVNGRIALEKFDSADFDLVITDKAMPEMNGDQLAAAVKARNSAVPVLMLTGFDSDECSEHVSEFIDRLLPKPVSQTELRAAILALTAA